MKLTRTPIASAVALVLVGVVASAQAQTAPAKPELGTVTVTGIRASQEESLNVKRNSDSRVEVISAEDIGKMPDKNVADSLQRVAGVTISSAGASEGGFDENDRVSMRGTNPSLTQTLINGHNIASGDWFVLNQTGTVGRSVSYSLLPSELVGQVIVRKGSEASLVEGGVAGSVDIITRKPLDFKKPFTAEVSVGVVNATLPGKTDPQFSALVNWKSDDKTVGVMVQAFSEKRSLRRDGIEVLGYTKFAATDAAVVGHPDLVGVSYPNLIGTALFEQERKRDGGLIDFQFKPTNDLTLDLTTFSSKLNATNYNRNYLLWGSHFIPGQAPDAGYVVRNNTLVSANYSAVAGTQYGIYDMISRPDESASSAFTSFDAKLRVNDALTLSTKLGTSEGHGKTPTQDVYEADFAKGTGASYALNGTGSGASFGFGSAKNTDLSAVAGLDWIFGNYDFDVVDKERWAQLDGDYQLNSGVFSSLKFGVRTSTHERSLANTSNQRPALDGSAFVAGNQPTTFANYPGNFGSGLGGNFPAGAWYYTADQLAAFNAKYALRPTDGSRRDFSNEYSLKEDTAAGYLQANLEGKGWSGNIGLRAVTTKESVVNYQNTVANAPGSVSSLFGTFLPVTTDNTYNDILPSASLRLDLAKDMVGRLSVSKTMTRADYSALAGSVSLSPPSTPGAVGSGSGGNPDLAPIRSTNVDATFEYYFAPRSLASASVFYMDLQNYIGLGSSSKKYKTFDNANPNGYIADYLLTVPVNSSGSVTGIELAYEQPLGANFGFATNYTYTDAKESGGGPLVGASKNTFNLSGYYEDNAFNARISYTARSAFYSGLDRKTAYYQGDTAVVSASFGYKVNDNLSFTFDAQNLNDPKLTYYAENQDQPRAIYQNGRQYYLNARIKF